MFNKCMLAKFEWEGYPRELSDTFIEGLILNSTTGNFAVCDFTSKGRDDRASGEFWGYFDVMEREPKYGRPTKIFVTNALGETYTATDFVLFDEYKNKTTPNAKYIAYYTSIIKKVNHAIEQHIAASELVANIYAASNNEKIELEKLYKDFCGIKIVKHDTTMLDGGKKFDIVQFDVEPRLAELEQLKHDLENDLFLRIGVANGFDKTHITNANLKDSEQARDLINAYELKRRENFCARYNAWHKGGGALSVKIHSITNQNSIQEEGGTL